ncbi:HNH endonuclease signature motif containing protein [Streptomyces sp. NK15101]|uniref:HNH endonuclease signature motif containing protein n=1 Tax=Streptomyces sp. NK15101 TaxID=2873261 RepID=UPI001CECAB7F|nr:HNH endonuclease signature motif containing protein [Streptomyces sp. NK15101]
MGTSAYTKERLEAAARGARTLTEALERLGVDPRSGSRRYLHDRMRKLGVDTSHFEREGVRWTREVLAEAVAASTNMCEVLRRLGVEVVGGQHTHISRRIKAYGIDVSHFRAPSRQGKPWRPRTPETLLVEQTGPQTRRIPSDRLAWALAESGAQKRCAMCGNDGLWRGRPLRLEIDHVDGDWRNNRIENLRFLCPNCHSATDNYRGRGKGRRR